MKHHGFMLCVYISASGALSQIRSNVHFCRLWAVSMFESCGMLERKHGSANFMLAEVAESKQLANFLTA
jgi:hypothetical protein